MDPVYYVKNVTEDRSTKEILFFLVREKVERILFLSKFRYMNFVKNLRNILYVPNKTKIFYS